jgi:hypothetical protein
MTPANEMPVDVWVWTHPEYGMMADNHGEGSIIPATKYTRSDLAARPTIEGVGETIIGVGDGSGDLFVRGKYEAIKRVQGFILENEKLRKELAALDRLIQGEG